MNAPFEFPKELHSPIPRELPERFAGCRSKRTIRNVGLVGLSAGFLFAFLSLLPASSVSDALPILRYMGLISLVTTTLGFGALIASIIHRGDARYLTHGIAARAKITSISCNASHIHNGMVSRRAFDVGVEIEKYETGPPIARVIRVFDMESAKALRHELTLQVGQWTTVVYLKSDFEKTLKLYDCLDFHEELPIRERADVVKSSLTANIVGGLAIAGLFALLFFNIWAMNRFDPIGGIPWSGIAVIGGISAVLGVAELLVLLRAAKSDRTSTHQMMDDDGTVHEVETNDPPMGIGIKCLLTFGVFLMPMIMGCGLAGALNTWFDGSEGKIEMVEVTKAESKIHRGIYQTYTLNLTLTDRDDTHHPINVDAETYYQVCEKAAEQGIELDQWGRNAGIMIQANIKPGAFGWPWVSGLVTE